MRLECQISSEKKEGASGKALDGAKKPPLGRKEKQKDNCLKSVMPVDQLYVFTVCEYF